MKDNKTIFYEELSQDFEMPEYAEFSKAMDDPKRRKALYDKLLPDYDLPDFETFSNYLAAKPVLTDGEAPVLANYDVSSLPEEAWVPKAGEPSKEESSWGYIAPNPGSEFTVAPFKTDERSKQVVHKPFAEEHPMGMSLSNETQVPLKPQEKFTTTYEDALPKVDMEGTIASAKQTASEVGQIGQAIAERGKEPFARGSNATDLNPYKTEEQKAQESYVNQGMAQASRELRPEIQIDMELEKINAELEELEKEYYSSDVYLQSRIVKSAIPGAAKAAWDEFAYASPRIIELQKRKTALLQAKEYRAIADEISANNKKYNAVGAFFANTGVGAGAYLTGKLNSANSAHRTDGILTDKLSLSNKIQNGEALSQSEQETMTIYALEDMMESKYGSAERNLGYIAGYGAPQMIEFMVELALSPGRGLAKAGMSAGEKLAAKTVSRLTKKYGASAVAKMLEKMGTYTLKQSGRILGATGNAMVATATTQADDLVRGTGERMAGRFVGERDAEGNLIGASVVDTKSLGRAAYEQGTTQTIENLSEAIFEGMGIGKGVSAMISKAGGKAAGTKLGGKILKGATYKTVSELMERTAAKDWYQATSKVMKAMHLGSFPEEVMEEYAAIPMKHWAGVSESGMTLGEELLSPETFYTTMAGLSLGMGGMTAVSVAPATISAGIDIYNSRKAHKALRKSDAVGASVFGAEWADIKSRVESIREEDFGIEMATLLEEYETEEQKSAIYDYMIRLQYDRGYNQMRRKSKEEQEGQEDAGQRMEEAYEEGYDMEDPQARNEVKSRLDDVTALYGETIEESIAKFGGAVEFLRNLEGKVSQETMDIVTEYINLKETVKGIQDSQEDNIEARIEAMHKDVANRTHKQSGAIVTTQLLDEQGDVVLDPNTGAPVSFYVVDADMLVHYINGTAYPREGSAILRDANGKLVMVDNKRLTQLTPLDAETVKAQNEATIRAEMEAEANAEAPVEGEEAIQVPTETSSVPTLEVLTRELEQTEFGKTALTHIDMMMELGEDAEAINQTIDNEYGSLAPKLKAYYQVKANAIAETAMAEQSIAQQEQEQIAAQEAEKESHIIRNKDNDLDVDAMIANGVTPEQMAEDLTAEFSNDDPGLALSTAQEYLAQVQEERAKTKSIIAKNGSLRKKEQFWSNVVGILTPQQESIPVAETEPVTETPQAEVPAEAQNANAKWQAAPKVYGRETTLRVKGMRLRGRYVVAPAGVATGSHTADFADNADFIHDEQGRSRNPRDYSQASNQATTQEIAGNFALQNMQIVSPDGIVYDGNGRQIAGDIAAQNGTDGAYLEDLMDRADEFGFTPEQIQGMEHPRVYFEVAPGQLDYSAQTFDKFNAPEMKAPSAVELGAAMGQVLSDETFNRLADTIKQSGGLSAVYKSKPLQEAIAYILRDASDVKDVTTATLPQYYNADTRTLTEAGRNLLEACLLGKIFADNPQVLALLPKLPNKVMSKVAQAMPELAANMQMGEYALKDELAKALTLVYEASQSGTSVNDYATQQDWTKGGSATDIFGKTVVMLAKALNGEIEGAELADVVRAYNVKAVDVVTGQGSIFEPPTREQMLQEVINYYMRGEVATQGEEVATQGEEVATEESVPQQEEAAPVTEESAPQQEEVVAQPKTREEKVNAMSDEEFSALLASNDLEAMRAYEQELHAMRGIDKAEREEYNRRSAKLAAIKAEFGEFDNAPASVRNEYLKMSEEIEAKYSVDKVVERQDKLSTRIFEVEAQRAREEEQREKEEKENYRKTAHNGFLAEKTPMGAAKADKALNKQYRVDGKVNTVAGFVEAWNEEGPIGLKVYENGNKTTYLVNGHDFGKTAYDYAQYLQSKKQQETTPEEALPSSDSSISEKVETARRMLKEYGKTWAEWVESVTNGKDTEAISKAYTQKQNEFRSFLMSLSEEELEAVSGIDSTAEEEVKKEERRRHHQAGLAEDYEKALSSQGEITPVAPKAKGSIFDATVKDETRPVFGGVYHKDGMAVATDGRILIEEKGAYEQEKEGQLVDKKGNVIEGQRFPNWKGVIPKDVEAFGISMESLRSFVEGVRQDAKKKGKKEADVTVVVKLPNGNFAYFELSHLVKFTNAAYRLGATELMLSVREEAPLLVQTEKGTAMLMPLLRASEEMYAYEISGKETEKTAPAEQKAEAPSHEELVEQNKQELSSYANRDLNTLIKKIKGAMPSFERRVERTEEGSEERQDAEAELKKWGAVLEAAESLLVEHKNGSWKNQFAVPLSKSKELSIEDVKTLFESLNGDKAVGELFEKVYAVAKTLGLKIKISDQLSTAQGNAGNDGIVKYAASLFYLPHSDQERASTLLHELIHTCTMYATGLHANRNNSRGLTSLYDGLPQQIKEACAELEEIYNNIKNDKRVAGEYGITSVNEMVAELSNPVFREKMKEINLWGKIVGAIKRLFGFEALAPEGSEVSNALAEAERVLVKMLDNFDKSTYDAIKDKLQRSGRGRRNAVLGERLNAFARSAEEFEATQREAVEKVGIVMPGLNEAELGIEDVPRHDFTGRGIDAIHKAEQWAKENLIGEHVYREGTDTEFKYDVTEDAVGKFLSSSSTKESDNLGVHLAVLKRLPQVINASIEAEIHPDYAKVNRTRSVENGVKNPDMLVHRFYGAVRIDGKIYLAKTTIQEFKGEANEAYDYKITEVKLIVSGSSTSNARTNPTSISAAKVLKDVEKSYDKGKKLLEESEKIADEETLFRQGDGRYTDEELSILNDPMAKFAGESFRTKKQQKEYAERVRNRMRKKANELAEKLHLPVEIIESGEDMAKLQGKKAKAKGWYEVKSGKIVLVLPNNESVADIVETVLHEGVAHLGLRKLFGKQFTQFLDNVYNHAEQSIREKIDEIARKNKVSTRTATEEYLASLAETTDFENINAKWWSQIKKFFLDMLHTIGFDYKGGTISDSELRYILWRSHENLKEPNPRFNVFSQAKDIVKQNKLKAEEKQAKERRRILSLGKTDSNPLVADRVNEEGLVYSQKKGVKLPPQEYALVSAIIQTYPNKSERGHVFTANNYYLCTDIDEEGNFKVVAAMPIEGNEELINELRGTDRKRAFKALSGAESIDSIISRLRRQGKRLGRNLSATEGQAGVDGRDDSVHLGQQTNSGADQRPFDRNDGAVEEETLYRMGDANDPNETAQRVYNEEMLSVRFLAKETLVDFLASVDALQNAIEEKSKKKILDFQNVYRRMLALSSKNAQELKLFEYTVMPKLTSAINKVLTEVLGKGVKKINWESPEALTLRRYAIVKHGIERNRDMAILAAIPRIAKDRYKAQFKAIDAQILAETDVDRANALREKRANMQKDPHKYGLESEQEIDDNLISAWYTKVKEVWDENLPWKEEQIKLDNSIKVVLGLNEKEIQAYGLTLTDEYSGIGATLINEGLLTLKETRKNPYAARAKAFEFVKDYESGLSQEAVNELWAGLHEVNQFSLDKQKKTGLVDQKYVDECNRRFKYYVPLRGFAEKTAQDVYEYMDSVRRDNNPVQSAKGRESEPGNPFASMMNVGFRSITAGNHNMAVQAFWYLANRPDVKGFLVPSRAWHLKDMNGEGRAYVTEKLRGLADTSEDDILPIIPENASPEEVQYIVENFENAMRELRAEGLAFQGRKSARQAYRTLNEGQKNEHRVKLYMNGETRYVTIVGNPRAAQALNGEIRPSDPEGRTGRFFSRINNFMASAFTSKNASFALANLARDTQHAVMRSYIIEGKEYLRKFAKHRATHANIFKVLPLLLKYQNSQGDTGRYDIGGTLDMNKENHRKFKDFMNQGGATGFTVALHQEEALKKLTKMVESANGKDRKSAWNLIGAFFDSTTNFSEAAELCNRYATYLTSLEMGRSEQRAISDAKEITLNFNRKGAGSGTVYKDRAQQAGGGFLNEVKYGLINKLAGASQYFLNSIVFWNAGIQGRYQGWHMLKKHPIKTLIAVAGLPPVMAGALMPWINVLVSAIVGGDEDEEDIINKYYDELPYYERQRNMCFYRGGQWTKIPLNPLVQPFWALGDALGASSRGKHTIRFSEDILPHVLTIFSPVEIDLGNANQSLIERALRAMISFTPSSVQPGLRVNANRDWKGKPLYNDSPYKKHLPSYRKGFKNDSPFLTEVSAWMNTLRNPDADTGKKGPLDFAPPGAIEELLAGYLGGYWGTSQATIDGLLFAKKGGVRTSNIPVVGRFVIDSSPGQINRTVLMNYNKEVKSFIDEVKQRESALKSDMEKAAKSTDDEAYAKAVASLRKLYGSDDYMKYYIMKNMVDKVVQDHLKVFDVEDMPDNIIEVMKQSIDLIHDDKAFEANEQ